MAQALKVGIPATIISESPAQHFAAVFEDDGDTGYFYAMEVEQRQIVDGVQIYDVEAVVNREKESEIDIRWSADGMKCLLLINRYPHAAFDFSQRADTAGLTFRISHDPGSGEPTPMPGTMRC